MKTISELRDAAFNDGQAEKCLDKPTIIVLAVVALAALALSIWFLLPQDNGSFELITASTGQDEAADKPVAAAAASVPAPAEQLAGGAEAAVVVTYISGAVNSPGVYTLDGNARITDLVAAAGGLRDDAQANAVNLAAPLADGDHVNIPTVAEAEQGVTAAVQPAAGGPAPGRAAAAQAPAGKVNINTADAAALQTLDGVGPATANRIIEYRQANGPFKTTEDLKKVSGIGERKYAAMAAKICV